MKANELSIGDWVGAAGPVIGGEERLTPPMRVVGIGETWVWLAIDPEQGDPFDEKIEDIRPVPLTDDILLENGWVTNGPGRFRSAKLVDCELVCATSCIKNDKGEWVVNAWVPDCVLTTPIQYVHELQRVMRLAGIEKEIEL